KTQERCAAASEQPPLWFCWNGGLSPAAAGPSMPARMDVRCTRPSYNGDMTRKHSPDHEQGTVVETGRPELARPPLYSVLLLNDDYTPMDFVVDVLVRFFAMDVEKATQVMLHVHTR